MERVVVCIFDLLILIDTDDEVEDEQPTAQNQVLVRPNRQHISWTLQEDMLLLQNFTLFNTKYPPPVQPQATIMTQWVSVAQRLSKSPENCYKRFRQLMKIERYQNAMQVALSERRFNSGAPQDKINR
jgi:hypothetical protein